MKKLISIWLILFSAGCVQVNAFKHSPEMAAKSAEKFAESALLNNDFQQAYSLMPDKFKGDVLLDDFISKLEKMHPRGYPSVVKATEYEPIRGRPGMNIFMEGHNDNEEFYYRCVVEGTAEKGYGVVALLRGNGPYPPSESRKKL